MATAPTCHRCGRPLPDGEAGTDDEKNRPGRAPLCRECADGDHGPACDLETLTEIEP